MTVNQLIKWMREHREHKTVVYLEDLPRQLRDEDWVLCAADGLSTALQPITQTHQSKYYWGVDFTKDSLPYITKFGGHSMRELLKWWREMDSATPPTLTVLLKEEGKTVCYQAFLKDAAGAEADDDDQPPKFNPESEYEAGNE